MSSPIGVDEPGSERDHIELQERFDQLRPEILETLRMLPLSSSPCLMLMNSQASHHTLRTHARLLYLTLTSVHSLPFCTETPSTRPPPILTRARLPSTLTALVECLRRRWCDGAWCMGKREWYLRWRKVEMTNGGSIWMSTGLKRKNKGADATQWHG